MITIGITGSLGSGKTTTAKYFKSLGASVIDADKIVHGLIDKPTRIKLAKLVFNHKKYLTKLNNLIHPLVIEIIEGRLRQYLKKNKAAVVIDAALLIESGLHRRLNKLLVVSIDKNTQLKRLKSLNRDEAEKRIRNQISLKEKIRLADFVVDNNGTRQETEKQVRSIWKRLMARK